MTTDSGDSYESEKASLTAKDFEMTDSGKKPREFWDQVAFDLIQGVNESLDEAEEGDGSAIHITAKGLENVISGVCEVYSERVTTCANCERLEGKLEAAHHWFDVTTKSNGNLIEENKRLQAQLESAKQLLLEHGRHEFACPACYDDIVPLDCICGFSDRLSKLEKK